MTIEPNTGKNRTLVVDDHDISCRYAVAALRQCCGTVRQARTATEALATALSWYPDLICMDIHLPDIDGLEVIRRIRLGWPADRPPPRVVILTGDDSGLKQSDLAGLNIEQLLVKPVSGQQLRDVARLHRNNRVEESGPRGTGLELRNLFRAELEQRLPELDQCVSNLDRNQAARILHQLIASSAICNEHKLESDLRKLDATCRRDDSTADLARAYYTLLESAQKFLYRHHTRQ
jgi:CheY-like chemotaxis protein